MRTTKQIIVSLLLLGLSSISSARYGKYDRSMLKHLSILSSPPLVVYNRLKPTTLNVDTAKATFGLGCNGLTTTTFFDIVSGSPQKFNYIGIGCLIDK